MIKNILSAILISLFCYTTNAASVSTPSSNNVLRVGIMPFTEPFTMQASETEYYGFDIAMMNAVCKSMGRTCQFIPFKRSELLVDFSNDQLDVAIGDFVINARMQQYINFSIPYMTSHAQFIGLNNIPDKNMSIDEIKTLRIGVMTKSAYALALADMGVPADQIKTFETESEIISAIKSNFVDVGFMNSYIANYWQRNVGGLIHDIGQPVVIGFGLGLIVNPSRLDILTQLNLAIYNYQNSPDFKKNFDTYLNGL